MTSSFGWSLEYNDLIERDGFHYKKFSDVPFTGKTTGLYQGTFKNGKKDGSWITYRDNGNLWIKGNYKNGNQDGSWVGYWDNGQLWYKGEYNKYGEKEGYWVYYWDNGIIVKEETGTFKDGKKISD